MLRLGALLVVVLLLPACANWQEEAGVDNQWRADDVPRWIVGQTTGDDVMSYLGPPSQVIALEGQVVFYYLKEQLNGRGYFFLIYNTSSAKTTYDRAIFFFDDSGVLTRYAYSNEPPLPD